MKNELSRSKLNELFSQWPNGTVVVQRWLKKHGISRQLADRYRTSSWIRKIGRGAYVRFDDKPKLLGAVYTLQEQLGLPVHVGAKSALEAHGYAHHLPMGDAPKLHLYGRQGRPLPTWFKKHQWKSKVRFHLAKLFPNKPDLGLTSKSQGEYSIRLSSPERAALELLALVPSEESFEGAKLLIEGLMSLRPQLVQELLEACRSVKAKRLFLYMAEKHALPWFGQLNRENIDLGKGKLQVVRKGRFDKKYRVTVPIDSQQEVP